MDKKLRMLKYISCMVKFRLADPQIIMNILKKQIDDFTEDTINIAVKIISMVGGFLLKYPKS